jgi:hypothetical protein
MAELELPDIKAVMDGEYDGSPPINELYFNKIALFLYFGLMGSIYSEQ